MIIRCLGRTDYRATYDAMRQFTAARTSATADELWLTEHHPVYTVGAAGRAEHLPVAPEAAHIDVVRIDRGGQITYHGPGQPIVYTLIDLGRRTLKVRALVQHLEQAVIDLLATYNVTASRTAGAPGVYVDGAKIAALGLRVTRHGAYHGVAMNVDMDLSPFLFIDPCGYPGLAVTQTRALGINASPEVIGEQLAGHVERLVETAHG